MRKYFFIIFIIFVAVFYGIGAQAAELRLISDSVPPFGVGQEFQVDLMLDPQGKEINAVSATLSFPENLVEVVEIRDGSSILTLWVERPVLRNGKVSFAGIAPGGFAGILGPYEGARPGKILEVVLRGISPGFAEITIQEPEILLHDGLGTKVEFTVRDFQLSIVEGVGIVPTERTVDTVPPEPFIPEIGQHPELFDGRYFLVFSTTDKQSGISHYEVQETKNKLQETKWERAESPYLLRDQDLKSYIYVKAVDRTGNERIEVIEPEHFLRRYESWWICVIIILTIVVLWRILRKKR